MITRDHQYRRKVRLYFDSASDGKVEFEFYVYGPSYDELTLENAMMGFLNETDWNGDKVKLKPIRKPEFIGPAEFRSLIGGWKVCNFPYSPNQHGQSLVEMAIITPLLLLMLLGLFEVGYVLRNQLIIINTSREAARLATKGNNLIVTDTGATGYETIVNHSIVSAAGQLHNELYVPGESGLVISQIVASVTITDCATGNYHVIYPSPGREYLTYSTSPDYESKVDFIEAAQVIGERNRDIACQLLDENGQPIGMPTEHVVIVEMFYTSHQLLGAPIVSTSLTDPIPLYSKTQMRKVTGR